jgi:hypothetical protein
MEEVTIDELKQLVIFYKQKCSDLEFEVLKSQLISARPKVSVQVDKKSKP